MGLEAGSPYLVAVGCCLVHHVKNPQRAGSLHAAPRARTCREEAGEGGGVRGEERVRLRLLAQGRMMGWLKTSVVLSHRLASRQYFSSSLHIFPFDPKGPERARLTCQSHTPLIVASINICCIVSGWRVNGVKPESQFMQPSGSAAEARPC